MIRLVSSLIFLFISLIILIINYFDNIDRIIFYRFLESDGHFTEKIKNINETIELALENFELKPEWITRKIVQNDKDNKERTCNYKRVLIPKDLPLSLVNSIISFAVLDSGGTIFKCIESNKGKKLTLTAGYRGFISDSLEFLVRDDLTHKKGKITFVLQVENRYGTSPLSLQNKQPGKIAISIPPGLFSAQEIENTYKNNNIEIVISLPLGIESSSFSSKQWAIIDTMDQAAIRNVLKNIKNNLPYAVGVITHGEAQATENSVFIKKLAEELKYQNLYFIDVLNSQISVAYDICQAIGLHSLQCDISVSPDDSEETIYVKLSELTRQAQIKGTAIGVIKSPDNKIIEILESEITQMICGGYDLV